MGFMKNINKSINSKLKKVNKNSYSNVMKIFNDYKKQTDRELRKLRRDFYEMEERFEKKYKQAGESCKCDE